MNEINMYQTKNGMFEIRLEQDTVWLSHLHRLAKIFQSMLSSARWQKGEEFDHGLGAFQDL
ncbi:MAG: hypothetical protein HQL65_20510, partial [Magnetococcales bacterium]|nr:hypothetical protein [Magnetococcales bacterium]